MTTLKGSGRRYPWTAAEIDRARAAVRAGPPVVAVTTMQTGPDEYSRTIQRLGDEAPLAIQTLRGPGIRAGSVILKGAAAERVLERARKSDDCLDILDADFDGE